MLSNHKRHKRHKRHKTNLLRSFRYFCAFCGHFRQRSRCRISQTPPLIYPSISVHSWFVVPLRGKLFFPFMLFMNPLADPWRIPLKPFPTPSWPFVVLRVSSWISFLAVVVRPRLFRTSTAPAPDDRADHTRVKQAIFRAYRNKGYVALARISHQSSQTSGERGHQGL